ncbi:MAG: hypothetical protein R2828_19305 [Saprospiraceae bacterium]
MKKKIIFTTISFLVFIPFLSADCYGDWTNAYNGATTQYGLDVTRCAGALSPIRCNREAEASYSYAVNTASNQYHDCILNME